MDMRKSGIVTALLVVAGIGSALAQDKVEPAVYRSSSGSPVQSVKETAVEFGHGVRAAAIEVGKKGVEVGHAFRDAAIHVGHAFRDSFRQVGQSFRSSGGPASTAEALPPTTVTTAAPSA
jgi:hypothetical protein